MVIPEAIGLATEAELKPVTGDQAKLRLEQPYNPGFKDPMVCRAVVDEAVQSAPVLVSMLEVRLGPASPDALAAFPDQSVEEMPEAAGHE